mgnify:CR=1 FL=1|tara:strand:- start:8939 stop:9703 length:765 start_codon:yes stop_codon:yes gene_type:complete
MAEACTDRMNDYLQTRNYLKKRLGSPVVCVEIDDSQFDIIIDDAIQDAARYLYGEGTKRDYLAFPVVKGTSAYELDCNITDAVSFDYTSHFDGINVLHSPTHMLLYNDWVGSGNYPGGPGSGSGGSPGALVSYDIAMMYLKEVNNQFSRTYRAEYHEPSRKLVLAPTPNENGTGLLTVWRRAEITDMMDHPIVKKLMVGRSMMQWGMHLGKYQIQMPGGGTTNGDTIYSNGLIMEEKAWEQLISEGDYPQFFIG